jgi:hypothetical protein
MHGQKDKGDREMRTILIVLVGLLLCVPPALFGGAAEPKSVSELMQSKLRHSQKVLEGIAVNDCDKIAANAEELIEISKATQWRVIKTPRYELYSNDFQRAAEALVKNAKDKNLDAATLSYVDLTLTCVKCHKHVREVRMVRLNRE